MKRKTQALYALLLCCILFMSVFVWVTVGIQGLIVCILVALLGVSTIIGVDRWYNRRVEEADRAIDQFIRENGEKKEKKKEEEF